MKYLSVVFNKDKNYLLGYVRNIVFFVISRIIDFLLLFFLICNVIVVFIFLLYFMFFLYFLFV